MYLCARSTGNIFFSRPMSETREIRPALHFFSLFFSFLKVCTYTYFILYWLRSYTKSYFLHIFSWF